MLAGALTSESETTTIQWTVRTTQRLEEVLMNLIRVKHRPTDCQKLSRLWPGVLSSYHVCLFKERIYY